MAGTNGTAVIASVAAAVGLATGAAGTAVVLSPGAAVTIPVEARPTWREHDGRGYQSFAVGAVVLTGWEPRVGTSTPAGLTVYDLPPNRCAAKSGKKGTQVQANVAVTLPLKSGLCVRGTDAGRVYFTQ